MNHHYPDTTAIMSTTNRPWNVPLPIFSEEFVEQLFLTIETQFRTAKIEENQQKFDYLLPLIPMHVQQNIPALHVTNRDYEGTNESHINEYTNPNPPYSIKWLLTAASRTRHQNSTSATSPEWEASSNSQKSF